MLTIRCTRKLLKRLDVKVPSEPMCSTNRLGDWYANLLFTKRARLIICISERSLLPVFVEATDPFSFITRFQEAVRSVLQRMGVPSEVLDCEAREMGQIRIGTTTSRRVLGSLTIWLHLPASRSSSIQKSNLGRSRSSSQRRPVRLSSTRPQGRCLWPSCGVCTRSLGGG